MESWDVSRIWLIDVQYILSLAWFCQRDHWSIIADYEGKSSHRAREDCSTSLSGLLAEWVGRMASSLKLQIFDTLIIPAVNLLGQLVNTENNHNLYHDLVHLFVKQTKTYLLMGIIYKSSDFHGFGGFTNTTTSKKWLCQNPLESILSSWTESQVCLWWNEKEPTATLPQSFHCGARFREMVGWLDGWLDFRGESGALPSSPIFVVILIGD